MLHHSMAVGLSEGAEVGHGRLHGLALALALALASLHATTPTFQPEVMGDAECSQI